MPTLTVTAKGQVTLRRELLQHLGIKAGDKIEIEAHPGGELRIKAAQPTGSIEDFIGLLAGQTDKVATIDEINEAISDSWAGMR
ncbi:MAG: AbrB/MazE/SpoVT family DNA-binding domain-containing protein [Lautropia sp.]|nr:AbrB/MazE/SpoVT family DNA-binding domain-containing protein [Lautropia sp.]